MESGRPQASRKSSSVNRWLLLAGIAVVAGIGVWILTRPARQRAQARHDVNVLAFALDKFAEEQGAYPQGSLATIARQLRGDNPRRLDYVEVKPHEMNSTGEFVDPWGTSYRIELDPVVLIYSFGPNRVDEHGEGDDIVAGR